MKNASPAVIVKCKCGIISRLTGEQHAEYIRFGKAHGWVPRTVWVCCWVCGAPLAFLVIEGRVDASVKCDHRCTRSKGASCTCSCGGENHGKAHA